MNSVISYCGKTRVIRTPGNCSGEPVVLDDPYMLFPTLFLGNEENPRKSLLLSEVFKNLPGNKLMRPDKNNENISGISLKILVEKWESFLIIMCVLCIRTCQSHSIKTYKMQPFISMNFIIQNVEVHSFVSLGPDSYCQPLIMKILIE